MRVLGIIIAIILVIWLAGALIGLAGRVLYILLLVALLALVLRYVTRRG